MMCTHMGLRGRGPEAHVAPALMNVQLHPYRGRSRQLEAGRPATGEGRDCGGGQAGHSRRVFFKKTFRENCHSWHWLACSFIHSLTHSVTIAPNCWPRDQSAARGWAFRLWSAVPAAAGDSQCVFAFEGGSPSRTNPFNAVKLKTVQMSLPVDSPPPDTGGQSRVCAAGPPRASGEHELGSRQVSAWSQPRCS